MALNQKCLLYQLEAHKSNKEKWDVTIVGAGAVGAYFAKQLLEAGHRVSIIARKNSDSLATLKKTGLTVSAQGEVVNFPPTRFRYVGDFENFGKKRQDLVIIALKQFDLSEETAKQVLAITDSHSLVGVIANGLPFYFFRGLDVGKSYLNSVDPGGKIVSCLKDRRIIGIQPVIASRVLAPAKINILRPLDTITVVLGSPENITTRKVNDLSTLFNAAGIKTSVTENQLRKNILEKLQFALSINTLSAIMERSLGDVFESEQAQGLIRYSIRLTNSLSIAMGIGPLRSYEQFKSLKVTKEHFSSLYHDIHSGKEGEVEAIIDATIELTEFLRLRADNSVVIPGVQPLIILKRLMALRTKGDKVTKEQLMELFDACEQALIPPSEKLCAKL